MRLPRTALLAVLGLALATATAAAQNQYTLQGTVRDAATGDGIPGVQVQLRGTGFGMITDATGRYLLRADVTPGSYELTFTFIGRTPATRSVELGAETTVSVPAVYLAESALELEELVVTGTTAPTARRAIGNAITSVGETELETTPAVTVDQALQGKVSGALITSNTGTPGGGVSIRLRGTSSVIAGAEPLIIVDGVIMDNSSDQVLNFGYRSNPSNRLADLDPADIDRIEVLKGAAAAALYGSRANNGVIQIFTKRGAAGDPKITVSTELRRSTLPKEIDFALSPVASTGAVYPTRNPDATTTRYNHQDLIFEPGYSNETHVSLSGGSEGTQYYLSGGYTSEDGIMIGSDYKRYNARLNLDQSFGDVVTISGGLNYIASHNDLLINGEQGTGGVLTAIVFTPTDVDLAERDPETGELMNTAYVFPNPLNVIDNWSSPQDVSRLVGSFMARAAPTDNITLRYSFGYDTYAMETAQFIPRGATLAPLGRASSYKRDNMLINNDLVGNIEWGLGQALDMTTSAGMNHTFTREENLVASASDLSPLTELVRGATQSASESMVETATLGFFGQQQVAFNQRLFLTGALRWDASSTFGEDERWQLYPKLSGSWLVSDEPFLADRFGWLNEFRLRAALGYAGNQPPRDFAYSRFSRYANTVHVNRLGLVHLGSAGNAELKPERQREFEFGFDASVLEDRIGLAFTYYNQRTDDLLLTQPFAPSTGYNSRLSNVGELTNVGIEAEITTTNIDTENFRWNSSFIYSMNENEMVQLAGESFCVGYNNCVIEGEPLGIFKMSAFARDENGNVITDEAGPVRADTSRIVGNPWPDFQASLRNEFRMGDLSLSFLLDGQFGHEVWNQTQRIMDLFGAGPKFNEYLEGEVTRDQYIRHVQIWESYLEDASFIKLRDVSLTYRVPDAWAGRFSLDQLQLELKGRNLYTWTDYSGYDPEINMFGLSTVARGVDFAVYPHARTFTFGVRATY